MGGGLWEGDCGRGTVGGGLWEGNCGRGTVGGVRGRIMKGSKRGSRRMKGRMNGAGDVKELGRRKWREFQNFLYLSSNLKLKYPPRYIKDLLKMTMSLFFY